MVKDNQDHPGEEVEEADMEQEEVEAEEEEEEAEEEEDVAVVLIEEISGQHSVILFLYLLSMKKNSSNSL